MSGCDGYDSLLFSMLEAQERAEMAFDDISEELGAYKEYYEADQNWRRASAIGSSNEDYLQAAERLKAAQEAVQKLRGE